MNIFILLEILLSDPSIYKMNNLRGAVVHLLDCGIIVSEFELQSRY